MNNSSAIQANYQQMDLVEIVTWCVLNGVLAIAAIFGNSLVIIAFTRFKRLRTRTNFFIVGLSVADVLVGLISMPMWMATMITIWLKSTDWMVSTLYRAYLALDAFSGISSILHLMLISLERLYAIGWPINHRVSSKDGYLIVLTMAWLLALGAFSLFIPKKEISIIPRFYVLLVLFFVPLIIILATYVAIWWIVKLRKHDTNFWTQNKEVKLAFILFLVSVLFVAAWTPFMVVNTVVYFCRGCYIDPKLVYFSKILHYSNSVVNPVLYSYRIADFKKAFLAILWNKTWHTISSHTSLKSSVELRNSSRAGSMKKGSYFKRISSESRPLKPNGNTFV